MLQASEFSALRSEMDELFAKRATESSLTIQDFVKIDETAKALLAELKKYIRDVPANQYIASKEFVKSLAYEVRQPAG